MTNLATAQAMLARSHLRADTTVGDVGGLFVRVPPAPVAAWPLVDALSQPYGQGKPLTWLASVPTTGGQTLEKGPLGGAQVDLRASMGTPRTLGTWTDISSQVVSSPGALGAIAALLGAVTAANVDRDVAEQLVSLGRLSASSGDGLVALESWPGPRLVVLSGQAIAEVRDWNEFAESSAGAVVVLVDPYIGFNFTIATAGVALGVLPPASLQADDPALFGVDVAHAVVFALEASPDAVRWWRSRGSSGGGGGAPPALVPPTVTSVTPNTGVTLGGERVRVLGADLEGATEVLFGAAPAAVVLVSLAGNFIDVDTPPNAAGPVDVSVTTAGGTDTRPGAFTYIVVTPPVITRVSPTEGLPAGGEDVAVTGTGLSGTSSVLFGPNPGTSIVVRSDTRVTCVAPAGTLGTVDVSATTLGGTGTLPASYTYTDTPLPVPTVTAISPDEGLPAGATDVVITGAGFTGATEVLIGANPATGVVVNSDTELAAVTPAGALGWADVTVVAPGGTGTLASGYHYTDTPVPPPAVTAVNPATGPSAGATPVVITGTNLTGATSVMFGPNPATDVIVANPTTVNCVTPAGTEADGPVDVSVTTIEGTGTLPAAFTYYDPATLASVVPNTVVNPAAGTLIRLTGTNLTGATQVYVCGSLCGSLIVESDTSVTCTIPNKPAMTGDVTVHTPSGRADLIGGFTYSDAPPPPPTVTGVNPNSGRYTVTTPVTVTGTNFSGATRVQFGVNDATGIVVDSATSLRCNVPVHNAAGPCHCEVFTPSGSGRLDNAFTYTAPPTPGPPTVTSVDPNHGPMQNQNPIRITGTWYAGTTRVWFSNGVDEDCTDVVVTANPDQSGNDYIDCLTPYLPGANICVVRVQTPLGFSNDFVQYSFDYPL